MQRVKKKTRIPRKQGNNYLKLEKQESQKQKHDSIQWATFALLPAAYIFMYAYRVGQCFCLGIPIEVAPITINDFLQYLVPTTLFFIPALSISLYLRKKTSRKDNLLFIPTFFFTLIVICFLHSPSSITQKPETIIWLFVAVLYFITLLALQIHYIIKHNKEEKELKNYASPQLSFGLLLFLVWIYAMGSVPGLLVFFLLFSIILLFKTTSNDTSTQKHASGIQTTDSKIATRIMTVAITLSLALFSIMLIGYFAEEMKASRPTLILAQDKTPLTYDENNALCILIMQSDHVAICTPANKEDGNYWIPNQSGSFLRWNTDIKVIDISAEDGLIKPNTCTVKRL